MNVMESWIEYIRAVAVGQMITMKILCKSSNSNSVCAKNVKSGNLLHLLAATCSKHSHCISFGVNIVMAAMFRS